MVCGILHRGVQGMRRNGKACLRCLRRHAAGKIKPALGKFKEYDLAARAGYRICRLDALYCSRSVIVACGHRPVLKSRLSIINADLKDSCQRNKRHSQTKWGRCIKRDSARRGSPPLSFLIRLRSWTLQDTRRHNAGTAPPAACLKRSCNLGR
jgi:hypothetical protein